MICCESIYFVLYGALSSTVQWKGIWFWFKCRAMNCQSSYSCWVFSQPRSLCLLFGCCAITLKMNHLPLWVLCFWPVYLPHQHRFWTNLKTRLNLISATIILLVNPLALSRFKMDLSASEEQQTRLPFLCGQTQKHSVDRVKGFCVCNTLKYKDDKRNKQWKWACFCRGEWLMNMSCVLHTSSWSIVGEVMKSL